MIEIIAGDCVEVMKGMTERSVQCCVTSPPYYGLRDYGVDGQIGLEETPEAFIEKMVAVFREVKRVLKDDGVLWVNMGDSYASAGKGNNGNEGYGDGRSNRTSRLGGKGYVGYKPKNLMGMPWRLAFALQADGWILRQDIIWHKPSPMPESVRDRCTKSHEYIFLLTKNARYFYDAEAISEPCVESNAITATKNKRSVWTMAAKPFKEAHFAVFPPELPEICIKASTRPGDRVLDPFCGEGTTGLVAARLQRQFVGIELNPDYCELARKRINEDQPLFNEVI